MSKYNNFLKRTECSTIDGLKKATFDRRLKRSYNKEKIFIADKPLEAIIQTSRLSESADYKKISLNLKEKIKSGQIIYWDRLESYWLIFQERTTEKSYFLGEMQLAKYKIYWRDKYGNKYSEFGCLRRKNSDIATYHGYFDAFSDTEQLLLPLNEETKILKRYDKIKIANTTYLIKGIDDINRENIIVFYLETTESNDNYDTETLPYGKVTIISEIITPLDNIKEISLKSSINFIPVLKINNKEVDSEKFKIICNNCYFENNKIAFDNLGIATITIKAADSKIEKILNFKVLDNVISTIDYLIEGPSKVRAMLSYTYHIKININGALTNTTGTWSIKENKIAKISESGDDYCTVIVQNNIGKFTLQCEIDKNKIISKEITILSLL